MDLVKYYLLFGVFIIVACTAIMIAAISNKKTKKEKDSNVVWDSINFYKTNYEAAERKIEALNREIDVLQSETYNLPRLRVGDYVYCFVDEKDKPPALRRLQVAEIRWDKWGNHPEVEYTCTLPDCGFPADTFYHTFWEEDIGKNAFPAKDKFYEKLFLSGKTSEEKEEKNEKTSG